jgi:hypothetical protein
MQHPNAYFNANSHAKSNAYDLMQTIMNITTMLITIDTHNAKVNAWLGASKLTFEKTQFTITTT